jgi:hypothetical protein
MPKLGKKSYAYTKEGMAKYNKDKMKMKKKKPKKKG